MRVLHSAVHPTEWGVPFNKCSLENLLHACQVVFLGEVN